MFKTEWLSMEKKYGSGLIMVLISMFVEIKTYMAKDVHRTLIEIVETHGGMSKDDATNYVEKRMMKEEKRYLRDVY